MNPDDEDELRTLITLWFRLPPAVRPIIRQLSESFLEQRAQLNPDGGIQADELAINAALQHFQRALYAEQSFRKQTDTGA